MADLQVKKDGSIERQRVWKECDDCKRIFSADSTERIQEIDKSRKPDVCKDCKPRHTKGIHVP